MLKSKAVNAKLVDRQETALNPKAWPDDVIKVSNNIGNQFESPMLFYALTIVLFLTNGANHIVVALMFVYVSTRCLHAYFHVTKNHVPHRFKTFLAGIMILLGLTLWQLASLVLLI